MYKSLVDPAFDSLKAIRVEIEAPLGEHAQHFLSSCALTHLHIDCHNQETLEAAMSAASKCQTLQYIGLKPVNRNRDVMQKLLLSEVLEFPKTRSKEFFFSCEQLDLSDEFAEVLCNEIATSQHFERLLFKDCSISIYQLELLFQAIQHTSTLRVFHIRQVPHTAMEL